MLRARQKCFTINNNTSILYPQHNTKKPCQLHNFNRTINLRQFSQQSNQQTTNHLNFTKHDFLFFSTQKRYLLTKKTQTEEKKPMQPAFASSGQVVSDAYSIPKPSRGLVYNQTSMLSDTHAGHFFMLTNRIKHKYGIDVGLISIYMRPKDNPRAFLYRLKDYWKIGGKKKKNGIMMLYVANMNQFHIVVGEGLRFLIPKSERMDIEHKVQDMLKQGQIFEGIELAFARIETKIFKNLESAQLGCLAPGFEARKKAEQRIYLKTLFTNNIFFFIGLLVLLFVLFTWFSPTLGVDDFPCTECGSALSTIATCSPGSSDNQICQELLNKGRKKELELGACRFNIKKCNDCDHHLVIPKYLSNNQLDLQHCSSCKYKTVERIHTLKKKPMWHENGIEDVHGECHHCGKHHYYEVSVPALKYNPPENLEPATPYSRQDPEMKKMTPRGVVGPPGRRIPIGEYFFRINKD